MVQVYKGKDGNGPKVAVAALSLAIHKNECFGLLGPNGAGKTTTIKVPCPAVPCQMISSLISQLTAAFPAPSGVRVPIQTRLNGLSTAWLNA